MNVEEKARMTPKYNIASLSATQDPPATAKRTNNPMNQDISSAALVKNLPDKILDLDSDSDREQPNTISDRLIDTAVIDLESDSDDVLDLFSDSDDVLSISSSSSSGSSFADSDSEDPIVATDAADGVRDRFGAEEAPAASPFPRAGHFPGQMARHVMELGDDSDTFEDTDFHEPQGKPARLLPWTYMSSCSAPAPTARSLELAAGHDWLGPQHTMALGPLRLLVVHIQEAGYENWDEETERNPLHVFRTDPMVDVIVMDRLVHYLHAHSLLVPQLRQHTLVIPPSVYQLALRSKLEPKGAHQSSVWQHPDLPTYVIIPVVIDEPRISSPGRHMHWYIWFGPVIEVDGVQEVQFFHLDSLPDPPHFDMIERRNRLHKVMEMTMPGLRVSSSKRNVSIEGYRQDPGSLDCGVFVAQAVSALLFEDPLALKSAMSASILRPRIERILSACMSGVLPRLTDGYRPAAVTLLHNTQLPSVDGFYSTHDLSPAPQVLSTAGVATPRPAPWNKQANRDYESRLLAGTITPLPRILSQELQRDASPARAASKTPVARRSRSRQPQVPKSSDPSLNPPSPRFSPYQRVRPAAERSMSEESGMSFVYGRHAPHIYPEVEDATYAPFFRELSEDMCSWGVGMLQGVRDRDKAAILVGAFLKDGPVPRTLAPDVAVVEGQDEGRPGDQENAMSVREFVALVRGIGNLEERDRAILTGVHQGATLNLDWRKDALAVDEDWLQIGMDIDSLSLTVDEPRFTASVSVQAFPARATTMTSDNRLRVLVDGVETPLSHRMSVSFQSTCPCF